MFEKTTLNLGRSQKAARGTHGVGRWLEGADGGECVQGVGFLGWEKSKGAGNEGQEGRMSPGFYLSTWWPHVLFPELGIPKEVQVRGEDGGFGFDLIGESGVSTLHALGAKGAKPPSPVQF